jgi:hypothetical protein
MASSTGTLLTGFALALGAVGVGVWAVRGGGHGRGMHGARTRRSHGRGFGGHTEQSELKIFIDNDGQLYRQQTTSIIKNLATKMAKGVYDRTKAEKLWMYLTESGAKKYVKDVGGGHGTWHDMFSIADRREVAKELNDNFLDEWKSGSYRNLLPKKYKAA